jgi:hypothetical protein
MVMTFQLEKPTTSAIVEMCLGLQMHAHQLFYADEPSRSRNSPFQFRICKIPLFVPPSMHCRRMHVRTLWTLWIDCQCCVTISLVAPQSTKATSFPNGWLELFAPAKFNGSYCDCNRLRATAANVHSTGNNLVVQEMPHAPPLLGYVEILGRDRTSQLPVQVQLYLKASILWCCVIGYLAAEACACHECNGGVCSFSLNNQLTGY